MRNNILTMCLASVDLAVALGCSTQSPTGPSGVALPTAGLGSPVAANFSGAAPTVGVLKGPRPRAEAWVDGVRFAGLVTPATFNPAHGKFDELYAGGTGFKDGVPLISESKPGDQDYNGGRWHMNVLKSSVDPDKYNGADRVEDLDLSDFESTGNYFECPLLPRRGNN